MSLRPKSIAVIGGGAAGLAAAVTAARDGANVTVFEAQDRVGNSIKVTGDGRCNIANVGTCADCYHNAAFVARAFQAYSPMQAIGFLGSMGLLLREEAEGRLYPFTNKATSVIDALRLAAACAGVQETCGAAVSKVLPAMTGGWQVSFTDGSSTRANRSSTCANDPFISADSPAKAFDAVVLACGGNVAPALLPKDVAFCSTT
ncbi:MAG: NAD(P)/FAD-dependent oxidoreductase, partial [Eggerthellaceae bacterium]|nr:NAD(P)/FAD-dependent oxidoreductase [Eggerthellaceae bacterium]